MTKCISTPLGDISTAYHTTGIENIEVFFELTPGTRMFIYMIHYLGWFYGTGFMQRMLMKYAEKQPEGPSEEERNSDRSVFVATVEGRNGATASNAGLGSPVKRRTVSRLAREEESELEPCDRERIGVSKDVLAPR